MDQLAASIIMNIATGYFVNFSPDLIKKTFEKIFLKKPELAQKLKEAKTINDIEEVFEEAIEVIDLYANTGEISIDGGLIEAIRGVRFNHDNGFVSIKNTTIQSNVLVTGGNSNSTGKTVISNQTEMKSKGTSISIGKGCSIIISGNAQIKQS